VATETDALQQLTKSGSMRIGLFIPCYIDLLFPAVGIATLELLERLGFEVGYPLGQTCCGQPMSNSGDERNAAQAEHLFVENFKDFDGIVGVPPPLIPVDQQGRLDILHGGHGLRAVSDGTRPHRCPTPAPPARSRASNNRAIPGPRRAEPSCLPASIYRPAGILLFPVQGVLPLLLHCGEADGQR